MGEASQRLASADRAIDRDHVGLSRCARPTIGPWRWNAYFVCGFAGYLVGVALVTALAIELGLDTTARALIVLVPPVTMLVAIKLSQLAFGRERIVFYQQTIAVVAATVAAVALAGGPAARGFDLATLGMGAGLTLGRVGCFRVACCHGRRARRGVRYRPVHAAAGFPARWVGLPLVPLQLVDAGVALAATLAGVALLRAGAPAGAAACLYIVAYGLARFALEFARGDAARPAAGGASEAQWTAVATAALAAALYPAWWTVGAAALLALALTVLLALHRWDLAPRLTLASAHHVDELAAAIDRGQPTTTRAGVHVTVDRMPDGRTDVVVTRPGRRLDARALTRAAAQLGHPWARHEIVPGQTAGLFHLLLTPEDRG